MLAHLGHPLPSKTSIIAKRQEGGLLTTTSSSYDYWWPYPPWGASTSTTTSIASVPGQPTAYNEATPWSFAEESQFTPLPTNDPANLPSSDWGAVLTSTSYSFSTSEAGYFSTPELSSASAISTTSAISTISSSASILPAKHTPKAAVIVGSLLAVLTLLGAAFALLRRRRRQLDNPPVNSGRNENRFRGGMGWKAVNDEEGTIGVGASRGNSSPWWSRWLPSSTSSAGHQRRDADMTTMLYGHRTGSEISQNDAASLEKWNPSTYGYGEWRLRNPTYANLTRVLSREEDAEEIDIDVSQDWRHYSSIYSASPPAMDDAGLPSPNRSRMPSRTMSLMVIGGEKDTFTTLPLRNQPTSSFVSRFNALPTKSPSKKARSHILSSIPFFGKRKSTLDIISSNAYAQTATSFPAVSGAPVMGIRRTSAGKAKTDLLATKRTMHLRERANNSKVHSHSNSRLDLQSCLSPDDDEQIAGGEATFVYTPRDQLGDIRHKSIRRAIAGKLQNPNEDLCSTQSCDDVDLSDKFTPLSVDSDRVSLSDPPPQAEHLHARALPAGVTHTSLKTDSSVLDVQLASHTGGQHSWLGANHRRFGPPPRFYDGAIVMGRSGTAASTVASFYAPSGVSTGRRNPQNPLNGTDRDSDVFGDDQRTPSEEDYETDVYGSAADYARASRIQPNRNYQESSRRYSNLFSPVELHRAQSTLPELPTGIMSPPLQAQLFFSPDTVFPEVKGSAKKPRGTSAHPSTRDQNQNLQVRDRRDLSRNSSQATTSHTITPPPSHFNTFARANATLKADMIVQMSLNAKQSRKNGTPNNVASEGPAICRKFSPVPTSIKKDLEDGIQKRLALLENSLDDEYADLS